MIYKENIFFSKKVHSYRVCSFKLVRFVNKISTRLLPLISYFPLILECPDDVIEAVYEDC